MIWNWFRLHPRALDVGLAALTFAISASASTRHPHPAVGIALGGVASISLLWRRAHPISVVGVTTAATVAALAFGGWPVPFQLAIALGTLAISGAEHGRSIAAASILATLFTLVADGRGLEETGFHTVFLIAAWFVGDSIGSRRAYVREIEEKAERLERERETEARRAVAEEQARIGRELHDVVAHALSVIVVQAGAADDVFEIEPERAHDAVRAIDTAARDALDDLRRVLGTLQDDGYQPQPGLGRLDSLVEQVRATGLDVSLQVEGARRPLPASVDLSAFRIVQEALTNVIKHAGAEHAKVRVRFGDELLLEIRDDGRGSANGNGRPGSGLIGMRERVALLGGKVETGNAAGGGFLVSAQIPV
jgi:signal transduction histidine kinase